MYWSTWISNISNISVILHFKIFSLDLWPWCNLSHYQHIEVLMLHLVWILRLPPTLPTPMAVDTESKKQLKNFLFSINMPAHCTVYHAALCVSAIIRVCNVHTTVSLITLNSQTTVHIQCLKIWSKLYHFLHVCFLVPACQARYRDNQGLPVCLCCIYKSSLVVTGLPTFQIIPILQFPPNLTSDDLWPCMLLKFGCNWT